MRRQEFIMVVCIAAFGIVLSGAGTLMAEGKYDLKAPNGLSFQDIRGYETWQVLAPSYRTDKKEVRYILGNPVIVEAFKKGVPGNGTAFPETRNRVGRNSFVRWRTGSRRPGSSGSIS